MLNACQAMPDGGQVTLRASLAGPDQVALEVSDTGSGIPERDQPYIFEPFFSTKPDALGLGLALVKRIVTDLGGQVEFKSQSGQGARFRITLPTARQQRTRLEQQARQQPQETSSLSTVRSS